MKRRLFCLLLAALMVCQLATAAFAVIGDGYGYEETDAASVTVQVTISSDGVPLRGNDAGGTVLSSLRVTVPYFDLDNYGLKEFYRYETEGGRDKYINTHLIRRPTVLHLYIYLLERYYIGLDEEDCCKGSREIFEKMSRGDVINMYNRVAYQNPVESGGEELAGMYITGSPCSMYMEHFWGHDQNLMYYRNHAYPLMRDKFGSTADYVLLSDGDVIDLAMFSNWSFYNYGAFCCFDEDRYTVQAGDTLRVQAYRIGTQEVTDGGSGPLKATDELDVAVYDADWTQVEDAVEKTEGGYSVRLNRPGTYYLLGVDPNKETEEACLAPATATVTVEEAKPEMTRTDSGVQIRYPLEQARGTLYAAAYRGGRLVALEAQPVTAAGVQKVVLKCTQEYDTVRLFWLDEKSLPLMTPFTGTP